ncbi:MAG: hypothetical protein Q8T08_19095, partial [Ignavibacteria bacterium]|nr:hypothetical protein [Ignavibacteria bacterium]
MSYFLEHRTYDIVWIIAEIYFIFNFLTGWIFGKRDYETLPLYDIGFRFHLASYLLFNTVSVIWFLFDFHSHSESIRDVYVTALFWGIFIIVHFVIYLITRRNAILGIEKSEIFE